MDVKDFPFTTANAGMTALMGLVAVMATEVLHRAIIRDCYFIDGKEAETFATEAFAYFCVFISTSFGETVLA